MNKIIALVVIVFIFGCSGTSDMSQAVAKQKSILPKRVNSFITWTDIRIVKKEIQNVYVVNENELALPLSDALLEIKTTGKMNIIKGINISPSTKNIITKGYIFRYIYKDLRGKVLHEFTVTKDDLT
jgi:hypothetical protein